MVILSSVGSTILDRVRGAGISAEAARERAREAARESAQVAAVQAKSRRHFRAAASRVRKCIAMKSYPSPGQRN
jgi:hypothetical protein